MVCNRAWLIACCNYARVLSRSLHLIGTVTDYAELELKQQRQILRAEMNESFAHVCQAP